MVPWDLVNIALGSNGFFHVLPDDGELMHSPPPLEIMGIGSGNGLLPDSTKPLPNQCWLTSMSSRDIILKAVW